MKKDFKEAKLSDSQLREHTTSGSVGCYKKYISLFITKGVGVKEAHSGQEFEYVSSVVKLSFQITDKKSVLSKVEMIIYILWR